MSYVSLLKNIPELLSQPTGIAAIASLGIHGAIALVVPLMPVDNKSPDTAPKSVGVLELSQADQSRLPQTPGTNSVLMQPQLPLQAQVPLQSQFPQQPQLTNPPSLNTQTTLLPPLPPPVTTPLTLPPIATAPGNYRIAPLPQSQSLALVPRKNLRFDNPGFNAGDGKFTPNTPPSFNNRNVIPETTKPLPIEKLPELNAGKLPDNLPPNLPNNTTPPISESGNDVTQVTPIQPQIAPIGETPKAGDNLAFAGESVPKWQQGSTLKTPEIPKENPQPGLISKVNSYEDLRKALQQEYPNSREKAVIRNTLSTDKAGVEGTVLGFLVVDTEGKVLDIKFQDKSIPPDLQVKAREYFTRNAPKGDKQINRYPFSLRFQNNGNNTATTEEKTPALLPLKPASTPAINSNQPITLPAATPKPLPQLQPREVTPKPLPQLQLPPRETTPKPLPQLQPREVTPKPLPKLPLRQEQSTPTPTGNVEVSPSPEPTANNNQLSSSVESSQKLIEKLREARQQQQQNQDSNSVEK